MAFNRIFLLKIAAEKHNTKNAMRKIRFSKMHGAGNDYIYVNAMQYPIDQPAQAALAWSDRHKGIGADRLVASERGRLLDAHIQCRRQRGHDVRQRVTLHRQISI